MLTICDCVLTSVVGVSSIRAMLEVKPEAGVRGAWLHIGSWHAAESSTVVVVAVVVGVLEGALCRLGRLCGRRMYWLTWLL